MAVLTPKADPLADWDNMPDSHARILYNNLVNASSVTDAEKTLTPNTWERWTSASGSMDARFQTGSSVDIDSVAIAAHNLGSTGSKVVVATSGTVNGTFTDRASITPTDNSPIYLRFDKVEDVQDVKITITGGTDREVGIVYAGESLQMYRPIFGGVDPLDLNVDADYRNNISESGQFLGRTVIRRGSNGSFRWKNLDDEWVREKFKPFMESAITQPFFINWRPDFYDSTSFGYTTRPISISNSGGGNRLMSVSLNFRGFDE